MKSMLGASLRFGLLAATAAALTGCAWLGDSLGAGKNPPDEFVVVDKRPLVAPPDFKLRPPEPGKPSPQNIQPAREVVSALFPNRENVQALLEEPSRGEKALLKNVEKASPDIRSSVNPDTKVADKGQLVGDILELQPRRLESDGATVDRVDSETTEVENAESGSGFFAWLFGD